MSVTVAEVMTIVEPEALRLAKSDGAFTEDPTRSRAYTSSLTSSLLDYRYENGRRYHSSTDHAYPLPNDEKEQERLDLAHHLFKAILDGELTTAPLKQPKSVLDIGTGTGLWAIEFGDEHSQAQITGIDISPIQPSWVPPNVSFLIDDMEDSWSFDEKFDFIHARMLGGSVSDMPRLLRQAVDHLQPGGWIEFVDFECMTSADDDSIPKNSAYVSWIDEIGKAAKKNKRPLNIAPSLAKNFAAAGLENVTDKVVKVPTTPWAKDAKLKDLGRISQFLTLESLQPYSLYLFTEMLERTQEETEAILVNVRKELRDPSIHWYTKFHFVTGQKPL